MAKKRTPAELAPAAIDDAACAAVLAGVAELLEAARHAATRAVHSLTAARVDAPLARMGFHS